MKMKELIYIIADTLHSTVKILVFVREILSWSYISLATVEAAHVREASRDFVPILIYQWYLFQNANAKAKRNM